METTDEKKKVIKLPEYPHYVAATQNGWGVEMDGTEAVDGSNIDHAGIIGLPMTNFTIEGKGIKKARVKNKRGRWSEYSDKFDKSKGLGNGTDIIGIEIVGSGFIVSVHVKGGSWLPAVKTSDIEGKVTIGIGTTIDAIWVDKI